VSRLIDWLQEPELAGCGMDGLARFRAHRAVLDRKPAIREVFQDFHRCFADLDQRLLQGEGAVIELGAGVYPVRESLPAVLATDVVAAEHLDRALDAQAMDLPDASVRAFYLQNAFHHFPEPDRFFDELERTLVPGGGAVLIEPASGALASLLYPRLFASEGYDKRAAGWETPVGGPMSGANQALSHLVFDRDLARFRRDHPTLDVVHSDVLGNWLRYLLSGGLNFRALLPSAMMPLVAALERLLLPLRGMLGLHRVLVIRKRTAGG
jgi:SAM-dependent methyltransferase